MSSTLTRPFPPVLVRADEAERLDLIGHVLLADSSATAGALSSHRVALGRGADGAVPHRHDNSSELFYILDGAFDLLVGDNVVTARAGDLLATRLNQQASALSFTSPASAMAVRAAAIGDITIRPAVQC
jgi:mannose-6-phosphate isomerase-like protein (cupin superfamily)